MSARVHCNQISGEADKQTHWLVSLLETTLTCANTLSVLTAHSLLLTVCYGVASESCQACYCECHAIIVSSVRGESYSKHSRAREFSVCFLHMWGSVKLNSAEGCHSGRGNDNDNTSKLKHVNTSNVFSQGLMTNSTTFRSPLVCDRFSSVI